MFLINSDLKLLDNYLYIRILKVQIYGAICLFSDEDKKKDITVDLFAVFNIISDASVRNINPETTHSNCYLKYFFLLCAEYSYIAPQSR
jgi:hypothetical protein